MLDEIDKNWDESVSNEALIDGKVIPYDACGQAANETELTALKQTYAKAFPIYLGYGSIYSVQKIRQYGLDNHHFFAKSPEKPDEEIFT